jgi:hypothetical protein
MQQYNIQNNLKTKFKLYGIRNKKQKQQYNENTNVFFHQNLSLTFLMNFFVSFKKNHLMF